MPKFFLFLVSVFLFAHAKDPKFEAGLGLGSVQFPDYMGSKSLQSYTLPFPYMIYTSEYFNVDKEGIRGKILDIKDLELELSLGGSLPANSENNTVRKNMPDLHLTFEIGPKIIYKIFEQGVSKLHLELPVRAVFSSDFKQIDARGILATPQLRYALDYGDLELTLISGIMLADKEYHSYFYEVKKEYETASREAYETSEGYTGLRNRFGISYKKNNYKTGAFISHYNLKGAVFQNSPLVETNEAIYLGVSLAYIFYSLE